MKGLYEFYWDCGRAGDLHGIFVAEDEAVKNIIGKYIYFGEVLGRHSEVDGKIEEGDIVLKTHDQDFITKFEEIFGEGYSQGYNPLDYYGPDEDTDEENEE